MTTPVDQIIKEHGLTRENTLKFVALSPAYNRKEIADEIGLSVDTVHRYKQAFREMATEDRIRLMADVLQELVTELGEDTDGDQHAV